MESVVVADLLFPGANLFAAPVGSIVGVAVFLLYFFHAQTFGVAEFFHQTFDPKVTGAGQGVVNVDG